MPTVLADNKLYKALLSYRLHYLNKNFEDLDESSTRIIINHLLSDVLGYKELVDIKTEYPVKGGYIDYLIEIDNKKKFVIEVKSIKTKLVSKHLRQAIYYSAMVGADWIIITNAQDLELYKVRYAKPLRINKVFSINLKRTDEDSQYFMSFITKRAVMQGELDNLSRLIID